MLKEQVCSVCGNKFLPIKNKVYLSYEPKGITDSLKSPSDVFDTMDCPFCGCQTLLKKRFPIVRNKEEKQWTY